MLGIAVSMWRSHNNGTLPRSMKTYTERSKSKDSFIHFCVMYGKEFLHTCHINFQFNGRCKVTTVWPISAHFDLWKRKIDRFTHVWTKSEDQICMSRIPTLFRPPPILPLAVFEVSGIFSPKCVIVGMLKLIMVFGWLRICIRLLGYSQLIHPTLSYGWYHHLPMKSAKNVTFMTWGREESARIWDW